MRNTLCGVLLCGCAASAAAQGTPVTFEEPQPVAVTGFAVGRADYDRLARSNSFTAGKIGVSLFKPVGEAYLFAQLTTALEDGQTSTEIKRPRKTSSGWEGGSPAAVTRRARRRLVRTAAVGVAPRPQRAPGRAGAGAWGGTSARGGTAPQ